MAFPRESALSVAHLCCCCMHEVIYSIQIVYAFRCTSGSSGNGKSNLENGRRTVAAATVKWIKSISKLFIKCQRFRWPTARPTKATASHNTSKHALRKVMYEYRRTWLKSYIQYYFHKFGYMYSIYYILNIFVLAWQCFLNGILMLSFHGNFVRVNL